jgi:hypothetical protein
MGKGVGEMGREELLSGLLEITDFLLEQVKLVIEVVNSTVGDRDG